MTPEQEQLVLDNLDLAERIARNVAKTVPSHVTRDDLVSDAYEGLIDAARRYDNRGVPFRAYAYRRVVGAIYDGMRRENWAPKERVKDGTAVFVGSLNRVVRVENHGDNRTAELIDTLAGSNDVAAEVEFEDMLDRLRSRLALRLSYESERVQQFAYARWVEGVPVNSSGTSNSWVKLTMPRLIERLTA